MLIFLSLGRIIKIEGFGYMEYGFQISEFPSWRGSENSSSPDHRPMDDLVTLSNSYFSPT